MRKEKQLIDPEQIQEITELTEGLRSCARCLDGNTNPACPHADECDDYVSGKMFRCLDLTEEYGKLAGKNVQKTVENRVNGFKCKNILTQEYKSGVSKTLAETAAALQYTIELYIGR